MPADIPRSEAVQQIVEAIHTEQVIETVVWIMLVLVGVAVGSILLLILNELKKQRPMGIEEARQIAKAIIEELQAHRK